MKTINKKTIGALIALSMFGVISIFAISNENSQLPTNTKQNEMQTTQLTTTTTSTADEKLIEALKFAINDEYNAQAAYNAIIKKYGSIKPFTNIVKAEANHISLLKPLFTKYNIEIPANNATLTNVPTSLTNSYALGVEAEKANIAIYEGFLKEDLPEDVKIVFQKLKNASKNHLKAFQNKVDGKTNNNQGNQKGFQGKGRNR